jgi:putative transposase
MSGPRPASITLSARQRSALEHLSRCQTASVRLVRRAGVLLALADDPCLERVASDQGLTRVSVRLWRDRWLDAAPRLAAAEAEAEVSYQDLLALIEDALGDAPRLGGPATFSPEQIVQIVAVACEPPEKSGRPISHWTHAELADEVKKRHIVQDISPRSVGRFLKGSGPSATQEPLLAIALTRSILRSSVSNRRRSVTCTSRPEPWPSRASTS